MMQEVIFEHIKNIYPYGVLPLICLFINIIFFINIILQGYRRKFAKALANIYIIIIILFLSIFLMVITPYREVAEFLKYIYFAGFLLFPFFLISYIFYQKKYRLYVYLLFTVLAVFYTYAVFSDYLLIKNFYFGFYPSLRFPSKLSLDIVAYLYFLFLLLGIFYGYIQYVTNESSIRRNRGRFLWLATLIGYMSAVTDGFVVFSSNRINFQEDLRTSFYLHNYIVFALLFLLFLAVINIFRLKYVKKRENLKGVRDLYVILIMVVPISLVLPYIISNFCYTLYPITSIGSIISAFLLSYAVLKYYLIDIAEVFRKFLIYSIVSIIFISFYILFIIVLSGIRTDIIIPVVLAIMIFVFLFNPLYMTTQNLVNRIVFSHKYDYQDTIKEISMKLVTLLDYNKLLDIIRDTIINTMGSSSYVLFLYNNDDDAFMPVSYHGGFDYRSMRLLPENVIVKFISASGTEILTREFSDDLSYEGRDSFLGFMEKINSTFAVPMTYNGILKGILCLGDKETGDIYTEQDTVLIRVLANQAIIALENARLYALSITDDLTNLYIPRFFQYRIVEEIIGTLRLKRVFSLFMIDIDYFKYVNDTFGHPIGDRFLKQFANLLKGEMRLNDIIVRYGGEEFVILLPDTNNDTAFLIAERIRKRTEGHVFTKEIKRTISIGIVTVDGEKLNYLTEETKGKNFVERTEMFDLIKVRIIKQADSALYDAKRDGRNRCVNSGLLRL